MSAEPKAILRRWEELKQARLDVEAWWRDIDDYFTPRRSQIITRGKGELRDRRVVEASGMVGVDRLAAMTFGFMINPAMPFVRPDVGSGLIANGRAADDIDLDGRDYLDGVSWGIHGHLMSAQSGFTVAVPEALNDWAAKGTGVVWTGRKRGFGARYQSRSMWSCWIAENEDGEIDTLYYAFAMPAWRVRAKWPDTAELKTVKDAASRGDNAQINFVMAVEPRIGGMAGNLAMGKPFMAAVLMVDEKVVVEESGYDSFPYSVPRFAVRPGEVYGYGPPSMCMSDVKMLNAIMEAVVDGAEKIVDPAVILPLRAFPKAIDRRRGATNYYQASQMGMQTAEQAVRSLVTAGDINVGVELIREIRRSVEFAFYTDWMRLRESGSMTATEVGDRRDMRLRGMSPIVSRAERDLMGPLADRTFEINDQERFFGDPPESMAGLNLRWGYTGPMALAQLQSQRESVSLILSVTQQIAAIDPAAAKIVNIEEAIRVLADSVGLPPAVLETRARMAEIREAQEEAQRRAMETDETAKQATALRDGAQAVGTMSNALRPANDMGEMAMAA
ncbi:portal protein [Brevundimonas sp.]|uniref:portal protein n=1 Tax=Brevundimonas sp. TaxID=1871086 RepID=UPI00262A9C27|nr:portal protein [Brevundimonas sp.]